MAQYEALVYNIKNEATQFSIILQTSDKLDLATLYKIQYTMQQMHLYLESVINITQDIQLEITEQTTTNPTDFSSNNTLTALLTQLNSLVDKQQLIQDKIAADIASGNEISMNKFQDTSVNYSELCTNISTVLQTMNQALQETINNIG